MTRAAQRLLDEFDQLPDAERGEVLDALLRRVAQSDHAAPEAADFVALADRLFAELDSREQGQ